MSKECWQCGAPHKKPRSLSDHRRLFGLIKAALAHWPEGHDFQPHDEEHLRKWLTCAAGHREVVQTLEMPETGDPALTAALMDFAEQLLSLDNRFGRWRGRTLAIYEAKSISWEALGQKEFGRIREEIENVIESETGLKADDLLKASEAA